MSKLVNHPYLNSMSISMKQFSNEHKQFFKKSRCIKAIINWPHVFGSDIVWIVDPLAGWTESRCLAISGCHESSWTHRRGRKDESQLFGRFSCPREMVVYQGYNKDSMGYDGDKLPWIWMKYVALREWNFDKNLGKYPQMFRLVNYYNLSKYMFFAQKGELWWGKTGASEVLTVPSRWKNKNVESTDMSVSDNGVYTHDGKLNFANWCKTIGFGYNIFGQTTQEFGAGECPPFFPGCSAHRFTSINPSKLDVNDMQDRKLLTHSKW